MAGEEPAGGRASALKIEPIGLAPVLHGGAGAAGGAGEAGERFVRKPDGIENEYIVVLRGAPQVRLAPAERAAAEAEIEGLAARHGAAVRHRYGAAVRGFSARMTETAARALAADSAVALVEQDAPVRASATQTGATFGLDRIDQRDLPLDGSYSFASDAQGITVFVIDTGVRTSHVELTGRIQPGFTAIGDGFGVEDCNGHGTHVAGSAAGTVFGVAKRASIVPVRVLDCDGAGTNAGVIAGVDFVTANHPARSIANMSLGGGASAALDAAVRAAVASGVTVVVAAGNETEDACNSSPAREPMAITVGATTRFDERADFSNFGSCVDLMAPGADILSAGIDGDTDTAVLSGTSMASPHVAGAAALFVAQMPGATPAQVAAGLRASATPNRLSDLLGSPNLLLHTSFTAAPPPPVPVEITAPVDGAQVGPAFTVLVTAQGAVAAEIAIDGETLDTDEEAPFGWDVSGMPPGAHTIAVTAIGAGGQETTDEITITVRSGGGGGGGIDPGPVPPPVPPPGAAEEGGCAAGGGGGGGGGGAGAGGGLGMLLAVVLRKRRRR